MRLTFIGNKNVFSVNVISYYFGSYHTSNNISCVYSYSHVKSWKVYLFFNFFDDFHHFESEVDNILRFLRVFSIIFVIYSQNDVAIPNRV